MRLKTLIALAAVGLAVAAPAALAQATRAKVSLLFVLEGTSARLDPVEGQAGTYTFTMPIRTAKHPVIWFTDRPARDAGTLPMAAFVGLWSARGSNAFSADPPNVAINYASGGKPTTLIATMSSPAIIPNTARPGTPQLQATMTAVSEEQLAARANGNGKLARHARNARKGTTRYPRVTTSVAAPSVFVDGTGDFIRGDLPVVPNDNGWFHVPYPKPATAGR
jgi:hypothetical protein